MLIQKYLQTEKNEPSPAVFLIAIFRLFPIARLSIEEVVLARIYVQYISEDLNADLTMW